MSQDAAAQANKLLEALSAAMQKLDSEQASMDEEIRAIKERYAPRIDELSSERDGLVEELATLSQEHWEELRKPGTKSILLRAGEISKKLSQPALQVEGDEETIVKRIGRHGGLRAFTRVGKRTLDKAKLKAAPGFVEKIKGIQIVQTENLVIKPAQTQGEIIHKGDPLKVPVPLQD